MVDAAGTTSYSFTSFGAIQSEDGPWANDMVSYSYDNGRRRSGLNLQAPNASDWVQTYGYDNAGRLSSLTSPVGIFSYSNHAGLDPSFPSPAALVRKLALPNGAYITNDFDDFARILSTTLKNSTNAVLNSHSYAYNELNQRTSQVRADGRTNIYTYDSLVQLATAQGYESNGIVRAHEQFSYGYDVAGNLTNRVLNLFTNSFTVNSLNELSNATRLGNITVAGTTTRAATNLTVADNGNAAVAAIRYTNDNTFARTNISLLNGTNTFIAVGKDSYGRVDTNSVSPYLAATVSFSYDQNGNLLTDGRRFFDYDDDNQLIRVTVTNATKSEFTYDGKMRRRIRKEFTWQSGLWNLQSEIRYVYDGNLVIEERDANNLPINSYTRGKDLSGSLVGAGGTGGLLAFSQLFPLKPQHAFYHAEANGNVTMLISWFQLTVAKYLYDPLGNTLSSIGPLAEANLYRFSSKELHLASDMKYYLYRYYDSSVLRWPNPDPLGEVGFEMLSAHASPRHNKDQNLYRYALNDSINRYDYLGLNAMPTSACVNAPDLKSDSSECKKYGNRTYLGAGLECFCECAPDDAWSQSVRGCLRCMDEAGVATATAHDTCYAAADKNYKRPTCQLAACFFLCTQAQIQDTGY